MTNKFYVRSVRQFYNIGLNYLFYFRSNYSIEELYDFFDKHYDIRVYPNDTLALFHCDIVVAYLHYHKRYDYYVLDISGYESYILYNILINDICTNIYFYK